MRVGLMQPYFFPYFEQFRLINQCDLWIVFDTVRFNRYSWMCRNRVLNRQKKWQYINVSVPKGASLTQVKDTPVSDGWQRKFRDRLRVYQGAAPNFRAVAAMTDSIIDGHAASLADLNANGLQVVCDYLGVDTEIVRFSDLNPQIPDPPPSAGQWGHFATRMVGGTEYLNASGGRDLIDRVPFQRDGINLRFYEHLNIEYETDGFEFVPDLSIIDAMMWLPQDKLRSLVNA